MIIETEGTDNLVIRLTYEEAARISVDHGEFELVIPIEDTTGVILEINDALASMTRKG